MIADEVGISEATVLKILHESLGMNKLLNAEQKLCREHVCQEN
jgi:predicted transcriptional regulator